MKGIHPEEKQPPKGDYWMVNSRGDIFKSPKAGRKANRRKAFGNYFKTRKIAVRARERMVRLFKRLKRS